MGGRNSDCNNHRIQVFTPEGKFQTLFRERGQSMGELNWPVSVAIDSSSKVDVSELCKRISAFTSEGQFVVSFGRSGHGSGEFECLRGLAASVDASGVVLLYVCDRDNNRIQVF